MAGAISSLLDISRRALQNNTQAIRVVGNNVANVNTTGYSRREIQFVDKANGNAVESSFGLGADINGVIRRVDEFVNKNERVAISDRSAMEARDDILATTQSLFSVDKTVRHIGFALSDFFSALNDLQANPGNSALRSKLIQSGNELTQSIRLTYETLSQAQRDADTQMRKSVLDINNLTSQIATLNTQIAASNIGNQDNLGLKDQRDQLLRELSEKISFSTVEDSKGQVSCFLENGFSLVANANATSLRVSDTPSFGPFPLGLDSQPLGRIVWNSSPATINVDDVDLTPMIAAGGGQVAGLLNVRGVPATTDTNAFYAQGDLPDLAARVESIAQKLLIDYNNAYRPFDGALVASADMAGNPPPKWGLFTLSNGTMPATPGPETVADLVVSANANFSTNLIFSPDDPSELALAFDENPLPGAVAFSPGNGQIATNLLALRDTSTLFTVGNFSSTTTIENLYSETVTHIGTTKDHSGNDLTVARDRESQLKEFQASVSGVSIDEELTRLIGFQRSFQASSRLIKISDDLLGEILNAVGG